MLRYLHTLSAILFYVLGASFFVAYLLHVNDILATASLRWLETGDLPLLCVGLMYGGLSVYKSLTSDKKESLGLGLYIGLPLLVIFLVFLFLKFAVHS